MFGQYLISLREIFEAALIIGIVMTYLTRVGRPQLSRNIWYGVLLAVASSIVIAAIIWSLFGGLSEEWMQLFEGISALIAVSILTAMIFWVAVRGKYLRSELQKEVKKAMELGTAFGLVTLAFAVVFREGLETILFLTPFAVNDAGGTVAGLILGSMSAAVIAYIIFRIGMKIEITRVFYLTSLLLILLSAGLAGYGIHELIEHAGSTGANLGWFGATAYDLNMPAGDPLSDTGAIGSIFAVMFGYSTKMEVGRLVVQVAYLSIFLPLTIAVYKKPEIFAFLSRHRKNDVSDPPSVSIRDEE